MKAKWYFSTLFLLFSLYGVFQEQVSIPNQEIVLEFVDTKINKKNIENTIADLKVKLLNVGVSNITIKETKSGTLKISYHSTIHIDNIKEEVLKENSLAINENPKNKDKSDTSFHYNIDIYELTHKTDASNLNNKFISEINRYSDRFTSFNYSAFFKKIEDYKTDQLFKIVYKVNKNKPFIKDRTSNKEPEVRAGPKTT